MPTCYNCGNNSFAWEDGVYVCQGCLHVLPGEQQLEQDCPLTQTLNTRTIHLKASQQEKNSSPKRPEWVIYDGFNIILSHMVKSLVECGIQQEVCDQIFGMWAAYLRNLGVAFCQSTVPETEKIEEIEKLPENSQEEEPTVIIPDWMLPPDKSKTLVSCNSGEETGRETDAETDYRSENDALPFVPFKNGMVQRKRKRKRKKSKCEDLFSLPESELSARDLSRKRRLIKSQFLAQSMSGVETDGEPPESDFECNTSTRSGYSRRRSLIDKMPECFPETTETSERNCSSQRISEIPSSRTVLSDPEYLTLTKLLSFLHGALVLRGELAGLSNLIRWIREGWIPFHGSHQLLPKDSMPLMRTDTSILGGVCQRNAWVLPLSSGIRRNTAKMLGMLGVSEIKLPPLPRVAEKIIEDLQLPEECVSYVSAIERMASHSRGWRSKKIGESIPNVESHAAALILVVMKLLFGLDGSSEFKISEFAEKANQMLKLEPASSLPQLGRPPRDGVPQTAGESKSLFVWDEWVRWIRYRQFVLDRTHVPTAVRHQTVSRMDPDLVLRYAESHGRFLSHHRKPSKATASACESVLQIIDQYLEHHKEGSSEKRFPIFRPCSLPVQGLVEQLLEFDSQQYGLLRQSFSRCSLAYLIDQKELSAQLKKADPPATLTICPGPAINRVELVMPFVKRHKRRTSKMPPLQCKEVELKTGPVISAGWSDDDDDDSSQQLPSLLLHLPSSAYWSLSAITDHSKEAWDLVSSQLPPTFLWLLELVCESIEEEPQVVYQHVYLVETLIFQRNAKLLHTLSDPQELKRRLVAALLSDVNRR